MAIRQPGAVCVFLWSFLALLEPGGGIFRFYLISLWVLEPKGSIHIWNAFDVFELCSFLLPGTLEYNPAYLKNVLKTAAAAAKLLQSCPTLWDPIDGSPPGSSVPGILQARTLEWVAISFSSGWKWKVIVKSFSRVRLFATPWTAAYQAPLSMGFSRQEYWSGLPLPSPVLKTKRFVKD